jgi:hypothetical protein
LQISFLPCDYRKAIKDKLMAESIKIDEEGEIDVEAIMKQIKAYVVARKMAAEDGLAEAFSGFNGRLDPDLYEAVYQLTMTYDQIRVPELITETSIPIIGRLWTALRRQFHSLALFYVNQLAAKQIAFNRHLAALASEIVKELERLPTAAQVTELHQEIEGLRKELLDLARGQDDG